MTRRWKVSPAISPSRKRAASKAGSGWPKRCPTSRSPAGRSDQYASRPSSSRARTCSSSGGPCSSRKCKSCAAATRNETCWSTWSIPTGSSKDRQRTRHHRFRLCHGEAATKFNAARISSSAEPTVRNAAGSRVSVSSGRTLGLLFSNHRVHAGLGAALPQRVLEHLPDLGILVLVFDLVAAFLDAFLLAHIGVLAPWPAEF